jgi:uncharacterized protein YecE (DUF72 family)
MLHPSLHLGTSSWSSQDWEGVFYPPGTPPSEYLPFYATRFGAVEVDATFYRVPSAAMTKKWRRDLPDGFLMAAKVPQAITHEKGLVDCGEDLAAFVEAMDNLGDRLGPLLFQFPYFKKDAEMTQAIFLDRLAKFLPGLPKGHRFALEIRNKGWLKPAFLDLLRAHGVALALIDHPWMPTAAQYLGEIDPITAEFAYVRWLGDRYGIEKVTKTWDKAIVDRTREMRGWVPAVREILARNRTVFGFFNNHYAGHAPASIELFEKIWKETEG